MACLSLFQGYYALNVYKLYGQTVESLNDDYYLTMVGSAAAILGTVRFIWGALLDSPSLTFKYVYGGLLAIQVLLGLTIKSVSHSRGLYAVWICLMMFTEGGHFTIFPNIVKQVFGNDLGISVYGAFFTWAGAVSLL